MTTDERYAHFKALLSEAGSIHFGTRISGPPKDPASLRWLGRLGALIEADGSLTDSVMVKSAIDSLGGVLHDRSVAQLMNLLHRNLAACELELPSTARGAYISVGSAFDAMSAIQDIFASITNTVLIVDAYMDAKVVREFAPLVPDGVDLALLTDSSGMRSDLVPISRAWREQWGEKKRLRLRVTKPRTLHDRVIFGDAGDAWILTQSIKDLAARSPASIQKVDRELAEAKSAAYIDIWNAAEDPLAA